MPVYTTRAKVKTALAIADADTSLDALIDQLLPAVDEVINGFTGRGSLASAAATEYYDGPGRELLILRRRPVTSVAGVWVDQQGYYGQASGAFPADAEWTEGADFAVPLKVESEANGGLLLAIKGFDFGGGGVWPSGRGNVKVTYTAGYSTIPKDLELAANNLVAMLLTAAEKGQLLGGETIGDYAYQLIEGGLATGKDVLTIGSIRSTLARYQELHV